YYTGWIEMTVMRLTDILMAFPYILLAIAIVAGLGPGLRNAMIAIAIVGVPLYIRLVRSVVLSVREREFVEAARALGSPDLVILGRHVAPHLVSPVIVAFSLDVGVGSGAGVAPLEARGAVRRDARVVIGRVGLGVAVRAGMPVPDVASERALRRAILQATSLGYADPAGGGQATHVTQLLETLT